LQKQTKIGISKKINIWNYNYSILSVSFSCLYKFYVTFFIVCIFYAMLII